MIIGKSLSFLKVKLLIFITEIYEMKLYLFLVIVMTTMFYYSAASIYVVPPPSFMFVFPKMCVTVM